MGSLAARFAEVADGGAGPYLNYLRGKSMSYMTAYESRLRSHVLGHLERDEALSLPLADVLAFVRADPTPRMGGTWAHEARS